MAINEKLRQILNEGLELTEEERFTQAIREELESEFDAMGTETSPDGLSDDVTDVNPGAELTPEEKLEELIPLLQSVAHDEQAKMQTPIIIQMIKEKAKNHPAEHIVSFLSKKFDLGNAPEVENVVRELAEFNTTSEKTNTVVEQALALAECMMPQIAMVFKPAGGMEGDQYVDRSREHVDRYVRRVNGEDVEINQALREMRALFDLDEEQEKYFENVFKVSKGILDEESLACLQENIGGTTSDGATDDTAVEPLTEEGDGTGELPDPSMEDMSTPVTSEENIANAAAEQASQTPEASIADQPESVAMEESTPTFYTEYRSLFENLEPLAEAIVTNGTGVFTEGSDFDYTHVLETLSRACTVVMKNGANGYGKEPILEKVMGILNEDFSFNEELVQTVNNSLRHAYEIGENYKADLNKSVDLYDECRSVDMTISLNEIVNMFAEDNNYEDELDFTTPDDTIMDEEEEARVVEAFNDLYNRRINEAFDDE